MASPTPAQARLIWLALTGLAVATLVALVAALIWGLGQVLQILAPVLWPLAVATVIAYLLDPVVDGLERKGLSRVSAIFSVFGVALLLLATVFGSVGPAGGPGNPPARLARSGVCRQTSSNGSRFGPTTHHPCSRNCCGAKPCRSKNGIPRPQAQRARLTPARA